MTDPHSAIERAGPGGIRLQFLSFRRLFRPRPSDETILRGDETISRFGADIRKQRMVISRATERRTAPTAKPGDDQVQTLSFILAFMLACPALAGNSDSGRPGIGTFAYGGSPIAVSASQPIVVATR
jgi:hypothetical protein